MCGACGASSARVATQHWSTPFLASVPARTAAAKTLGRWGRAAGWPGTVRGVAGGFEVATASGRRSLAVDLPDVLGQLDAYGLRSTQLLATAASGVVQGPPTHPGQRPPPTAAPEARVPDRSATVGLLPFACVLPSDPRRRFRVPGLLAWVAAAERAGGLGPVTVQLDLGGDDGLVLSKDVDHAVVCVAGRTPAQDAVLGGDEAATAALTALL